MHFIISKEERMGIKNGGEMASTWMKKFEFSLRGRHEATLKTCQLNLFADDYEYALAA